MQRTGTAGHGQELEKVIKTVYMTGNHSAIDRVANDLVIMTLVSLQRGNHPVIKPLDFSKDILPVPNMTVFDQKTGHYTGVRFPANCSMALDLFSINKNIDSRVFIAMEELKRMKLDRFIKPDDQISIILKNRWTKTQSANDAGSAGMTLLRVVNIESLLRSPKNTRGHLTADDFKLYFPDFEKQTANYLSFSQKCANLLQACTMDSKNYDNAKKEIAVDTKKSCLPRLTAEMVHYEFCRRTRCNYTPQFSREEHLADMIKLHKQDPELLKSAIKQSGYIVDKSMNRLFGNDMLINVNKTVRLQQERESRVNTRKQRHLANRKNGLT